MAKSRKSSAARAPRTRVIQLQPEALEDLRHWASTDAKIVERILRLIEDARRDPFKGLGKPEPLKYLGPDIWSRRITQDDRLVYRVGDGFIDVLQARYHY